MTRNRMGLILGSLALASALAPAPAPPQIGETELDTLQARKIQAARDILAQCREYLVAPPGEKSLPPQAEVAEQIRYWSRQLADARLDAAKTRDDRVAILKEEVAQAREFEKLLKDLVGGGSAGVNGLAVSKAKYAAIDAEVRLAREKAAK